MIIKIIALTFAGGNKYSFDFLRKYIPDDGFELIVLEYPGRGERVKEKLLTNIYEITEDLLCNILKEINEQDYIIYGHSMGALIAYLICKKIEKLSVKNPLKLVASGYPIISKKNEKTYFLPSDLFWNKVYELGGIPERLMGEEGIKNFFEPILRADLEAIQKFEYVEKANLTIPIDVIYGKEEVNSISEIDKWLDESSEKVRIIELEGNHFFIYEQVNVVVKYIIQNKKKN